MVFTEVIRNYGNSYDNNTGIFQAPIAGSYLFTVHLCPRANKYVLYSVMVNGQIETVHSDLKKKPTCVAQVMPLCI